MIRSRPTWSDPTTGKAGPRPNVLFLAPGPPSQPGPRFRITQYEPALRDAGFTPTVWTFFTEDEVDAWYGASHLARLLVVCRALWRTPRLAGLIRAADVVVVQREVLPFGPPIVEWYCARRRPVVWDVDDAVWEAYPGRILRTVPEWLRKTANKYQRLASMATEIWAGSDVLAGWCRQWSTATCVLPTVVPVPMIRPDEADNRAVGWIGSQTTGEFVEAILPALQKMDETPDVRVVGARLSTFPDGLTVTATDWSPEAEETFLESVKVGLYPIDQDHPLAEGKCGLKALLYMSRGIACVLTPTTTNANIVRDGIDGLHAASLDDWAKSVEALLDDDDLRQRLTESAYERVRDHYSLDRWAPFMVERLRDLTLKRASRRPSGVDAA